MTDDTIDLKPCPFCGGEAKAIKPLMGRRKSGPPWYDTGHRIVCADVGCSGCGNAETTYTKAVTQWNTRSAMPQQEVTVKDADIEKAVLVLLGKSKEHAPGVDYVASRTMKKSEWCDRMKAALRAISEGE